jgi:hypothetical protein
MASQFSPAQTIQAFELNAVANNMDDKDVLEKLLEVLNRIDGRLKSIECSVSTNNAAAPAQVEDVAALLPAPSGLAVPAESADLIEKGRELVGAGLPPTPLSDTTLSWKLRRKGRRFRDHLSWTHSSTPTLRNLSATTRISLPDLPSPKQRPSSSNMKSSHQELKLLSFPKR